MTIKEAQGIYRDAWLQHQMSGDPDIRGAMETTMDSVQPYCCAGDEWYEFVQTLPGYTEHWANLKERCNEMMLSELGVDVFAKPS